MSSAVRKIATYQDVLDAPDHMVAQVIDGELHLMTRPASLHAYSCSEVFAELSGRNRGATRKWQLLFEPELHLGADILVPDIAGWRIERMPSMPNVPYFTLVPDWICEVLSPSTAVIDRGRKLELYAQAGVQHAWLIDPVLRTLEVFRRDGAAWTFLGLHRDADAASAEPFESEPLSLASLWA